jgi:hypothetical protein
VRLARREQERQLERILQGECAELGGGHDGERDRADLDRSPEADMWVRLDPQGLVSFSTSDRTFGSFHGVDTNACSHYSERGASLRPPISLRQSTRKGVTHARKRMA